MNKDYRMTFIRDVEMALASAIDPDQVPMISNIITKALADYEIIERCTDLVPLEDKNERLMKRYAACLSIDGKSKKTVKAYLREIRILSDTLGKPFTEMGTYDLRYFLGMEKERGISNRTLENKRSYIASFFQWMVDDEIITRNPAASIKPVKYPDEIRKPFSETEIDALRSACDTTKKRLIVELLLSTGARVSELVNLRIDDINTLDLSVQIRSGKGGKDRTTYTTSVCRKYLQEYLLTRTDNLPWLLLNNRHEQYRIDGIQHLLKTLGRIAGVDDVHPHRFRRTFATGLAKRGMEVQSIQRLLGHSDISTTMIYVNVDDTSVRSSYQKYIA